MNKYFSIFYETRKYIEIYQFKLKISKEFDKVGFNNTLIKSILILEDKTIYYLLEKKELNFLI